MGRNHRSPFLKGASRMRRFRILLVICAVLAALTVFGVGTASASGTITFDSARGTGAPPGTLGPYTMTPLAPDARADGFVDTAGTVGFSTSLYHTRVGAGWATWSHGYTGDVYSTGGGVITTLALPEGTSAFYLYAEPDPFAVFDITAITDDGTSSGPIAVDGLAGARYFGFYAG